MAPKTLSIVTGVAARGNQYEAGHNLWLRFGLVDHPTSNQMIPIIKMAVIGRYSVLIMSEVAEWGRVYGPKAPNKLIPADCSR